MAAEDVAKDFELRDYLGILWRRKGLIVLAVGLVTGAAIAFSAAQTPVYRGTAEVLIQQRSTDALFGAASAPDPVRAVQTEIRLLQSKPVRDAVIADLGSAPGVSATQAADTNIIEVSAESTDSQKAAAIANAYATAYIDFRRTQSVEDVLAASKTVQDKISELQRQIDAAPDPQKPTLINQQAAFKQKLDQLQIDAALRTGGAQLATPASAPTSAVSPKPVRAGLTAFAAALILAMGLAFLIEYLDDSVKTSDDIEKVPGGPPVIGRIPLVGGWRSKDDPLAVSVTDPKSASAEAYRTLRTALQFLALEHPMKTLQITSSNAGEGKTTTLANLGVALSAAGLRVVMVCCDLRRPRIHEFFGLDNEIGFTSVLLGKMSLSSAIQSVPGNDHLFLLASGPLPPNPSELLSSNRTVEVLTSLQAGVDIVLIDCPPVLPVTDALVLSGRVDATLMVSVAGGTSRKEVARTVELLRRVGAPLVGAVLNGVKGDTEYNAYSYKYYRQPGHDEEAGQAEQSVQATQPVQEAQRPNGEKSVRPAPMRTKRSTS